MDNYILYCINGGVDAFIKEMEEGDRYIELTGPFGNLLSEGPCVAQLIDEANELGYEGNHLHVYGESERLDKIYKMIKKGTNIVEPLVEWVSFEEFKKIQRSKPLRLEKLLCNVSSVTPLGDGYKFTLVDGNWFSVYFNGDSAKKSSPKRKQDLLQKTSMSKSARDSVHYRVQINGCSLIVEKMVILAEMIMHDRIPKNLRGLCANVMDCTGNPETASILGLKVNLSPDNIELCWNKENLAHPQTLRKLQEWFGCNFKISANDNALYTLIQNGEKGEVAWYLRTAGIEQI